MYDYYAWYNLISNLSLVLQLWPPYTQLHLRIHPLDSTWGTGHVQQIITWNFWSFFLHGHVNPIVGGQTSPSCKVYNLMGSMAALCKTSHKVCWLSKWTSSFWPRKTQCEERWLYLTSENEVLFVIHITAQYDWTRTNVRNKAWNKHSMRNQIQISPASEWG